MIPIPAKLRLKRITDIVRISDARMSGTGFRMVVLNVAPEAAIVGPLAIIKNDEIIKVDEAAKKHTLGITEKAFPNVKNVEVTRKRDSI